MCFKQINMTPSVHEKLKNTSETECDTKTIDCVLLTCLPSFPFETNFVKKSNEYSNKYQGDYWLLEVM